LFSPCRRFPTQGAEPPSAAVQATLVQMQVVLATGVFNGGDVEM